MGHGGGILRIGSRILYLRQSRNSGMRFWGTSFPARTCPLHKIMPAVSSCRSRLSADLVDGRAKIPRVPLSPRFSPENFESLFSVPPPPGGTAHQTVKWHQASGTRIATPSFFPFCSVCCSGVFLLRIHYQEAIIMQECIRPRVNSWWSAPSVSMGTIEEKWGFYAARGKTPENRRIEVRP
jgi:hypothetical protein